MHVASLHKAPSSITLSIFVCIEVYTALLVQVMCTKSKQQQQATAKFASLAADSQPNRDATIAAGALPGLVALLKSNWPADLQIPVAVTFCSLAAGCQRSNNAIIAAGGLTALSTLLLSSQPDVPELSAVAVQL